jgi:hypothetical protein
MRPISNLFSAPLIKNPKRSDVEIIDSKAIFKQIIAEHKQLNLETASNMFNELSRVVLPIDKGDRAFDKLIGRLNYLIPREEVVTLLPIIEGVLKFGLKDLDKPIQLVIKQGKFSRQPKEICAIL